MVYLGKSIRLAQKKKWICFALSRIVGFTVLLSVALLPSA